MKVIGKIQAAAAREEDDRVLFSFEFFPPRPNDCIDNFFESMDRVVAHNPAFCDITWGAGGSRADLTLDIANRMQNVVGVETMMHLTCVNMPVEKIDRVLHTIKSNSVQNVLALRGDPPRGQGKFVQVQGGFSCALDLVRHIRAKHGDYFGITVAGYPEAHPDVIGTDGLASSEAYQSDLVYLKSKVDAGADLIITQLFYDTDIFLKFVNDCRQIGINCPIVPGIMPIKSYKGFLSFTNLCKTKIPDEITAALEPIKDNEKAVRNYGIYLGTEMCKKIIANGIKTLHLYTLNFEKSALAILMNLGLIEESKVSRSLPWSGNIFPVQEDVYSKNVGVDQYPHRRSGDPQTPSYGVSSDCQSMHPCDWDKLLNEELVVPLNNTEDIHEKFSKLFLGNSKSSLQPETRILDDQLRKINLQGFLTIYSQPTINGDKSDAPSVGAWGGPGGYVYQKGYLVFFCSPPKLYALVEKCKEFLFLTYMAVNKQGNTCISNVDHKSKAIAVTWGVFPGKEIVQPTVIDPTSFFTVWKDDAFEILSRLYPEGHASRKLLEEVQGSYFLVSLVDNDYINGDLFAVFNNLL